jgi:hypothetical protein
MGLESAVYKYVPGSGSSEAGREALINLGAEPMDRDRLVLRGPEHWVDVQLQDPVISLRIAFSNPPGAFSVLREAVDALIAADPGELREFGTDRLLRARTESEWEPIVQSFRRRHAEFQATYGEFIAPMSADDVFKELRGRNE